MKNINPIFLNENVQRRLIKLKDGSFKSSIGQKFQEAAKNNKELGRHMVWLGAKKKSMTRLEKNHDALQAAIKKLERSKTNDRLLQAYKDKLATIDDQIVNFRLKRGNVIRLSTLVKDGKGKTKAIDHIISAKKA